jgi:glycine/D-amino acid oxidase-like deaminating enzyme
MRDGPVVFATSIVVTTNVPINDRVVLHTKQAPYMTYVVALELRDAIEPALLWDTRQRAEEPADGRSPYYYVRMAELGPIGDVLLVGGEDHKTGQAQDAEARYLRLTEWARDRWPIVGAVRYRWSGQVMEPNDGLAYIGRNPADDENVYVCSGDSGNGMTHGTIAGLLITDLITGRDNPWTSLYEPSRVKLKSSRRIREGEPQRREAVREWLCDWRRRVRRVGDRARQRRNPASRIIEGRRLS